MKEIYFWSLMSGIAIPLLSLVLGGLFGAIDFDFDFDLDFDLSCFVPLSPLSLSVFLIGFGGTGLITFGNFTGHLIVAIVVAMIFNYVFTKYLIGKLKKSESPSLNIVDLVGQKASVIIPIPSNSLGKVSIETKSGTQTFLARSSRPFDVFEEVWVTAVENEILVVDNLEYLE